ncbi:rRNA processing protein EBP2 [Chloropicon primus]|uniref:rRNA processing protein EBP2 n=1 Tax=Chloropicon primus TaxID=1764295 RepID=A0A5B8MVQ5_9CHLO|nr:rRNA processing protein EBP2 [Chloropicon primus]UPR03841.1 rRNA processing protein EBP2 [Chloropicon primus]|eukprot:QDZ24633.1 rRNA processing protein EBP2 [Chloropicon primus]
MKGEMEMEMDSDEELALERAALGLGKEEEEKKVYVYNVEAMHERLEEFGRVDGTPWEDTLVCTSSDRDPMEASVVHDDAEREVAFYEQALGAVRDSVEKFDASGTKWRRPDDYLAEMVKSDHHMKRVKEKLLYEKKLSEEQEERRKQREAKKYAKQVQAEKLKERAQAKNKQISDLDKWRKQRAKGGYDDGGEEDYEEAMEGVFGNRKPKQAAGTRIFSGKTKSKKREARDKKFGFGGRKKIQKQNDAASSADDSGWRQGRFGKYAAGGEKRGGASGGVAKKKKGQLRPGKARRMKARGGK